MVDWNRIDEVKFLDDDAAVTGLSARLGNYRRVVGDVRAEATGLIERARKEAQDDNVVAQILARIGLTSREGMALLRLCEARLRTADPADQDRLVAEQLASGDWTRLAGGGTVLSGIAAGMEAAKSVVSSSNLVSKLITRGTRGTVPQIIRMFAGQFVFAETIAQAADRGVPAGDRYSFDMLGEGARSFADAERYEASYMSAIETLAKASTGRSTPELSNGISVKLSALHPRYEAVQHARVRAELFPRLERLAAAAAKANMNFCLDAEECDRLVLSLELFELLSRSTQIRREWTGLGLAVQAYQKRALRVIDGLAGLAAETGRRFMVRLVKGAYWDTEIKRAQMTGQDGYPVYQTKAATDLSYIACASALLGHSPALYPQFATHNAYSLAAVRTLAAQGGTPHEMQRLHGMGVALYRAARSNWSDLNLRIYAPIGSFADVLPYLVRRLLENGASSSFVNLLQRSDVDADRLSLDPDEQSRLPGGARRISPVREIFGTRVNSRGMDLSIRDVRDALAARLASAAPIEAGAIVAGKVVLDGRRTMLHAPYDRDLQVGEVVDASQSSIDAAFDLAGKAQPRWDRLGGAARARVLRAMGDALEENQLDLVVLIGREAGRVLTDGISEVREAVDYCRYYAGLAEEQFGEGEMLRGYVGETNELKLRGRGTIVCISPWNFPLAIFTGQVAAGLAAGNAVLAKPAPQTPLIAYKATRLFHAAGLDPDLLALIPGGDRIGEALVTDTRHAGVAFTGSYPVARHINHVLATRPGPIVPLVAETGGLNAIFVDSTALLEQVIDDVIVSAFGSAGQRCSSARLLFLPEAQADAILAGIVGACRTLVIGDPTDPAVDIGPLIDMESVRDVEHHMDMLERRARIHYRADVGTLAAHGAFVGPAIVDIPSLETFDAEIFGPVLHVVRYRSGEYGTWAHALARKNCTLTLGVHSRLQSFVDDILEVVPAGNVYVNRSIIGAVVGVQPFGGSGYSGTGPKAGGPHSLLRLSTERVLTTNLAAIGGDPALIESV